MAMASMKALDENDDLGKLGEYFLTCSLCQEYYKNAKTLQCLHSYCEGCLQTLVQKSAETLRCPECRCEFQLPVDGTSALASNFLINGLVEYVRARDTRPMGKSDQGITCDFCEEMVAEKRCGSCVLNLCEKCVKGHAKSRANKGHRLVALSDIESDEITSFSSFRAPTYCSSHEENIIKLYCDSCEEPICLECVALNHRPPEHKHRSQKEFFTDSVKTLQVSMDNLRIKETEARESAQKVTKTLTEAIERHQEDVKKIQAHTEEIIRKLRDEEKKLLEQVKKYHDAEKKQIECDIDHYEIAEKNIASVCDFINVLINYGDWEAAAQFKQATVRVNEVMKIKTKYKSTKIHATFKPNNELVVSKRMIGLFEVVIKVKRSKIPKYAIIQELIPIDVQCTEQDDYTTCRLQATLTDPDGKVKQLQRSIGSNFYRVTFREYAEGLYHLSLTVDGYTIPGSPFTIHVMSGENMAAEMKVGTVVVRGRHWDEGNNDDGNPPGTGKVMAERCSGLVKVKWSSTDICMEYFMKEGFYRCKLAGFY
ncbi:E3 ubiquitin-protein ligase TRIM56-like [Ptychodera flava]|uniref:E3 ubiquitin-protein ligase TRIM56-like n=1 Tax=Ptychodera flava TaxID=63121 RepID=UPI003969D8DB